jgi:hypothetical protein
MTRSNKLNKVALVSHQRLSRCEYIHRPSHLDQEMAEGMFHPVSQSTLYYNILKETPMRKEPPRSYCNMCEEWPLVTREHKELNLMLEEKMTESDEEHFGPGKEWEEARWGKYKTRQGAESRYREVSRLKRRRDTHAEWFRGQRKAVMLTPPDNHIELSAPSQSVYSGQTSRKWIGVDRGSRRHKGSDDNHRLWNDP